VIILRISSKLNCIYRNLDKVGFVDLNGSALSYPQLFAASLNNTLLAVSHRKMPISEYTDDIMYGSFPDLFPYGRVPMTSKKFVKILRMVCHGIKF
jgi:hypothetical protein